MSLCGSVLPAAAAGAPLGPAFGMDRIRACSASIFGGLLAGPAMVGLAGIALLGLIACVVGPDAGKSVTFALDVAGTALGMVDTTFAVVVLCRAYRHVVPPDAAAT